MFSVAMMTLMLLCMIIAGIEAELSTNGEYVDGRLSSNTQRHSWTQSKHMYYKRYGNTIPAAPVQGQTTSCSLDLSDELLGGVKAACMQGSLDKKHCCPVLAAWLMAARAKVALHPPLQQEPGMPLLPDDSLVCIASLKAALAARGIFIMTPASPSNASESCDVVTCFCGIHLSQLTSQSCPLSFSDTDHNSSSVANSSSISQPTLPHNIEHTSSKAADKNLPVQPSQNDTSIDLPTSSSAPLSSPDAGATNLLQQLAANCTDHSYRGCTRCLKTLKKEMRSKEASGIIMGSNEKAKECELIGLMWLLELNKTLYIPTVSAVVRALLYNSEHPNVTKCSLDTDNMPLALDYSELLSSTSTSVKLMSDHFSLFPITLLISIHIIVLSINLHLLM